MSIVNQQSNLLSQDHLGTVPWSTIYAVTVAIFLGVLIIAGVGFAGPEVLHNAAHDIRHGLVFPCH